MEEIRETETDGEIQRCFPVMHQLRPHLAADDFVGRVRRQMAAGYRLASLVDDGEVCSVAGYRFLENLYSGPHLYVDDLVTDSARRSRGYGERLFDWLEDRAREAGCRTLELDSGVQRHGAHRFYLMRRMVISSHHFRLVLDESEPSGR